MRAAANDQERRNLRMRKERIGKRIDLSQSSEKADGDALHSELFVLQQNKKVALRRWDAPRHPKQVDCGWQAQFGEAANFKPADAKQDSWCFSFFQKVNRKNFTALEPCENKNGIGIRNRVGPREPVQNELKHYRLRIAK